MSFSLPATTLSPASGDAHDAVVYWGGGSSLLGVVEVDVAIGGEAWIKRERLQTTITARVDLGRDVEERHKSPVGLDYT
jgi:hypothetical protein